MERANSIPNGPDLDSFLPRAEVRPFRRCRPPGNPALGKTAASGARASQGSRHSASAARSALSPLLPHFQKGPADSPVYCLLQLDPIQHPLAAKPTQPPGTAIQYPPSPSTVPACPSAIPPRSVSGCAPCGIARLVADSAFPDWRNTATSRRRTSRVASISWQRCEPRG